MWVLSTGLSGRDREHNVWALITGLSQRDRECKILILYCTVQSRNYKCFENSITINEFQSELTQNNQQCFEVRKTQELTAWARLIRTWLI